MSLELFNLYNVLTNYVFGSLALAIFGYAVVLFIIGRIFRISFPTQLSILLVYTLSMVTLAIGPLVTFIVAIMVIFYFFTGLLRALGWLDI
jgi:hypothetical protein